MSEPIQTILDRFASKVSYREMDKKALDISRGAASGNINVGDKNYSEWALINDDPLVVVNYVKSFITTLGSKLAAAPMRPAPDNLNERVIEMRLNSMAVELYKTTLADGYAFLGFGLDNGKATCSVIDARSIMFNGNEPTLKDATEIVVFDVLPRTRDDNFISTFPQNYVDFDPTEEKVRTSYYYKKDGKVNLDIYEEGKEEPEHFTFDNIDRLPIVRFYGEKFELSDKRYHYRGLYFQFASIIKATALAATKIQIRNATSDDDNYMVSIDAISNSEGGWQDGWRNSGVKTYDHRDANNEQIEQPITPIPHDNDFLIKSMELWKGVTADLLGPVVQSSSEAVTREEVLARNEVRDAIANIYLSYVADSLSECYRLIKMLEGGDNSKVVVQGGFLEEAKSNKFVQEIMTVYNLAKEKARWLSNFRHRFKVSHSNFRRRNNAKLFFVLWLLSDSNARPNGLPLRKKSNATNSHSNSGSKKTRIHKKPVWNFFAICFRRAILLVLLCCLILLNKSIRRWLLTRRLKRWATKIWLKIQIM